MDNKAENKKRSVKKRYDPLDDGIPWVHWTAFEEKGLPLAKQKEMIRGLREYIMQPNKYTFKGYLHEKGIPTRLWDKFRFRYPLLQEAHEYAIEYLGTKRFDAGASGEGREILVKWAGQYDKDCKEYMEWAASLQKEKDKKPTAIRLVTNCHCEHGVSGVGETNDDKSEKHKKDGA